MSSKIIVLAALALLAVAVVQVDATGGTLTSLVGLTSATTVRFHLTGVANPIAATTGTITLTKAAGATLTWVSCNLSIAGVPKTMAFVTSTGVLTNDATAIATSMKPIIDCTFSGTPSDSAWSAVSSADSTPGVTITIMKVETTQSSARALVLKYYATKAFGHAADTILIGTPGNSGNANCAITSGSDSLMDSGACAGASNVQTCTLGAFSAGRGAIGTLITITCTLLTDTTTSAYTVQSKNNSGTTLDDTSPAYAISNADITVFNATYGSNAATSIVFQASGSYQASGATLVISMPSGYSLGSATCNVVKGSAPLASVGAVATVNTKDIKVTTSAALVPADVLVVSCHTLTAPSSAIETLTSWGFGVYDTNANSYLTTLTVFNATMGMTALVNNGAGNAVATNTGVFTATITSAAVTAAAASKYNNIVLYASDATNAGFTAGVAASGTKCTVDGATFTQSTTEAADTTTTMVILRSAAAGGAITANTKLTITCTNMTFTTSAAASDYFVLTVETDSLATAAAHGTVVFAMNKASNAGGQTVGTVSSTLSVVDKAGTAFTFGAAPANYWTNINADQYLKISFEGVKNAVGAGSVITVTMPAAEDWVFDITNTKDNTTLKVAGTDVTAKYTIACATKTVCTFTPKVNTDGAITLTDAVEILFGKVTRSGAVVANESVNVSIAGNTSGGFYLPKSNSMGAKGSVMKASIAGKTLTGSVAGFENGVTAGNSNTATVTLPDTTYIFTTTADDCTGSLPAGKAITSAQSPAQNPTIATLTMKSDASIADAAAAKLAVLDFSCKLATVPTTFATGKTVAVTRHSSESGTFDLSEDKGSSAASASSTVGVVLGAVFGVVGLAQLTL